MKKRKKRSTVRTKLPSATWRMLNRDAAIPPDRGEPLTNEFKSNVAELAAEPPAPVTPSRLGRAHDHNINIEQNYGTVNIYNHRSARE